MSADRGGLGGRLATIFLTVLATLAVLAAVGIAYLYSGRYDVAATEGHAGPTRWALETLQRESVARHARGIAAAVPADSAALAHGFEHFHAMCVQCHGAPGIDRGELGQGLQPVPPRLEEVAAGWTDAELFWIVRHGIKLAGMPAFGPTHPDEQIWAIVGFMRQLEGMTEEEYGERVRATFGEETDPTGHTHAPGTPPHEH